MLNSIGKLSKWPPYALWLLCVLFIWLVISSPVLWQVKDVWLGSETYKHCFFVLPIAIYIAYSERYKLSGVEPQFQWFWLLPIVLVMFIWLLGIAGGIDVFNHLAVFALLPLLILLVVGLNVGLKFWFPLVFVIFAVPLGEELVPAFQEITADMSVAMLKWSGVPVYREGLYIDIPNGKFLVAEACSGIRFFVATVMLGALAAYWMFSSVTKRVIFFVFAIVLPIFANSTRAYGTMMVGHYLGMEHASGTDHLIYGWFFFALVIAVLLLIGSFFKDKHEDLVKDDGAQPRIFESWNQKPSWANVISVVIVLGGFALWAQKVKQVSEAPERYALSSIENLIDTRSVSWKSPFSGASEELHGQVSIEDLKLELQVYAYSGKEKDVELVSWQNRIHDPDEWTRKASRRLQLGEVLIQQLHIVANNAQGRTVWYWYEVPGYKGSSLLKVKLQQAINKIFGSGTEGVVFIISSPAYLDGGDKGLKSRLSGVIDQVRSVIKW